MYFSEYFLLAAATAVVVSAQLPNTGPIINSTTNFNEDELESVERTQRAHETIAFIEQSSQENQALIFSNAALFLSNGFINGTNHVSMAENHIMNAISKANKIILKRPKCVKKLIDQAFSDSIAELQNAVSSFFQLFGEAVPLSNNRAKKRLGSASVILQKAGFAGYDVLKVAENLFDSGIETGGNAGPVLLEAVRLAVESGFVGYFHTIQESVTEANQALKDAQCPPMPGQMENLHCYCEAAGNDPKSLDAIYEINEASNNALRRGANPQLVQQLRGIMICALGDIVKVTEQGEQVLQTIEQMAGNEPLSVIKTRSFKQTEDIKKVAHSVLANIYLVLGDVALRSCNQSKKEIEDAILLIEHSIIDSFLGFETAEELIGLGLSYGGDAPKFAIEAATQSQLYGKIALIQGISSSAKLVLSVL